VDTFARALIAMGVRQGSHVAIWATNVPAWFITFWPPQNRSRSDYRQYGYKIHEAEYLLRQSDTHTLVMIDGFKDSDYVGIVKELCPELAQSRKEASSREKASVSAQRRQPLTRGRTAAFSGMTRENGRRRPGGGSVRGQQHSTSTTSATSVHFRD
jgi:long-subunit acyl-CoA synthetase (AMP-forming)